MSTIAHKSQTIRPRLSRNLPLWIAAAVLSAAFVVLSLAVTGSDQEQAGSTPAPVFAHPGLRYDAGPSLSTRGMQPARVDQPAAGERYDGGPEEGTRGIQPAQVEQPAPGLRYDGGPEEGTRGPLADRQAAPTPAPVFASPGEPYEGGNDSNTRSDDEGAHGIVPMGPAPSGEYSDSGSDESSQPHPRPKFGRN
jgi:hypothetical protein